MNFKKKLSVLSIASITSIAPIMITSCNERNSSNLDFTINFTNESRFNLGDPEKFVSDVTIDERWIKNQVIRNKNLLFNIEGNIEEDIFINALVVNNIQKDRINQEIRFELKFLFNNIALNKQITFTGFKKNTYTTYTINFKSGDTTINGGDFFSNLLPSEMKTLIKDEYNAYYVLELEKRINENIESSIEVTGDVDIHHLFDSGFLYIDMVSEINEEGGWLKILLTISQPTSSSTDSESISKEIVVNNFLTANQYITNKINYINTNSSSCYVGFYPNNEINENLVNEKLRLLFDINDNFNLNINNYQKNESNKSFSFSITLTLQSVVTITQTSQTVNIPYLIIDNLFEEVCKEIKVTPSTNPKYNYREITAKEFYNASINDSFFPRDYFEFNLDHIYKKFGSFAELADYSFVVKVQKGSFDFKNPRTLTILGSIVQYGTDNSRDITLVLNDFKEDNPLIGELDKQPSVNLTTPTGAASYKGKLEKFLLSDIKLTSRSQYSTYLKHLTWDMYNQDFMYLARFELYQMFSDNFSEINYYGTNENNGKSFTAVAEGIIKDNKTENNYYFQSAEPYTEKRSVAVNTGDKIKIEIAYTGTNYKPTCDLPDYNEKPTDPNYIWWWNFSNNCNKDLNDHTDPLYQDSLFINQYVNENSTIHLKISKNDQVIYEATPNKFKMWSFTLRKKFSNN